MCASSTNVQAESFLHQRHFNTFKFFFLLKARYSTDQFSAALPQSVSTVTRNDQRWRCPVMCGSASASVRKESLKRLTWDFVQLIHELVLQLGKGLVLLAGARSGHVGRVGARCGGGGGGRRRSCRRQCFPPTLIHLADAGQLGRCWGHTGQEREREGCEFEFLLFCRCDRCVSEAARAPRQVTAWMQSSCWLSLNKHQLWPRVNSEQSVV